MAIGLDILKKLEQKERVFKEEYAHAHAQLFPGEGAEVLRLAGGSAVFCGQGSPVSNTVGLGNDTSVTEADLLQVEEFFQFRGVPVRIETGPINQAKLEPMLRERGYQRSHILNLHVLDLSSWQASGVGSEVEVVVADDLGEWARVVGHGFAGTANIPLLEQRIYRTTAAIRGETCYLARLGGEWAGGGGVNLLDGFATVSSASTLPEFRRRGVQRALLVRRLTDARAAGIRLATVLTRPGSDSERNVRRLGFQYAYSKTTWVLER